MKRKPCKDCDQPMVPPGKVKIENEYDHAQGCPQAVTPAPAERDPRIDPVKGDVLQNYLGPVTITVVHPFEAAGMLPDTSKRIGVDAGIDRSRVVFHSIEDWRKWAATAEIIRRGDARQREK